MTLIFAVAAGIVIVIVVAAVLAALATAIFGAAVAAVSIPFAVVKARLKKDGPVVEPVPPPSLAIERQPVLADSSGWGWLRPMAAVIAWAGLTAVVDTVLRK